MRSRNIFNYLCRYKNSHHSTKGIISRRCQSTAIDITEEEKPSILQSDESILGELETFELSEAELTKISDANGATIIDGIEYLQPSDFIYAKLFPVKTAQFLMDWCHDYMPFWLIVLTVPWITKALFILPSIVYQNRKYEAIAHLMPKAMEEFAYLHNEKKESDKHRNSKYYGEMQKNYLQKNKAFKAKYGFNPYTQQFKQIIPLSLQIPVHMSLFVATRTMYPSYPDWKEGGVAWFTDLSLSDPYYIWPIVATSTMILSGWKMTSNADFQSKFPNFPMNVALYATTAVSLACIPISSMFPVGLNIYVASNIVSYLAQTSLLDSTRFRDTVGLKPKSYLVQIQTEIAKTNKDLKQIVGNKRTAKIDTEIKGKRERAGKTGRRARLKTVKA